MHLEDSRCCQHELKLSVSTFTQYWILSAQPGSGTDERLHVGIFVLGGTERMAYVANSRLEALPFIFSSETTQLIKELVQDLSDQWLAKPNENSDLGAQLSLERLAYLERYSNNLLHVGPAQRIDLPLSQALYSKLIERFF